MSDSSDEQFIPEIPENSDKMLFVEDLFGFFNLKYPPNYDMEWDPVLFRCHIYNAFNPTVQSALQFLDNTLEMEHEDMFHRIQSENSANLRSFEGFAEKLAAEFPEGFEPKCFLIYCADLCRISAYFYNSGVLNVTVLAKMHILKFLQRYNMKDGVWDAVHRSAEFYAKLLLDCENIPTPQSIDSDESGIRYRPHNVVSDEEQSSSPIEEQNVFSGNEENKLEEQQERACSKEKTFLKESAQSSSESSSKESKLSEDSFPTINFKGNKRINRSESKDNLGAETPNNGMECIFIKSECKRRMNLALNYIKRVNLQTCLEGNKLIEESAVNDRCCSGSSSAFKDSPFTSNIDGKDKMDISLNTKENNMYEAASSEENISDNHSLDDTFCTKYASNTDQISSSTSKKGCKRKRDSSPNEKNGTNNQSTSSDENSFVNKSEPNEKLFSKVANAYQMPASKRRKL